MDGKGSEMEELRKTLSELEVERDYYRQVAERLGRKALADAQDFSQIIRGLRQREMKLHQSQEELEKTIEERTAELVIRNNELSESTLRYDNLVNRIPHGVYTFRVRSSGERQFDYVSPPFCQILDIDREKVQRKASLVFSIVYPDDREGLENSMREANEHHIPFRWEGRFMVRQEIRWMRLEADLTIAPGGDIVWNGVLSDTTEQRHIQDKLQESEERLTFLVKNSSDSLVIINGDGSQRYCSPAAERITGFPITELEGKKIEALIHPDDMEAVKAAWRDVVQHPEKTVTVQYRHIHKTRGWVFSEAIAQSFLAEPATNGVIASVRDITDHKRVERFLRDVITKNPMSIQILDKDGLTLEVNPSYTLLFGSVPPDGYSIFTDPQLLQMGMGTLFDQLRNGASVRFPDTYFNAHDSVSEFPDVPAWIRTLGFPLNDDNGKPERFVLMHENITERKQAEADLLAERQYLTDIIDSLPDATFIIDTDQRVVVWNRAAEAMTGVKREELLGKGDYAYAVPFYGEQRPILIDLLNISEKEREISYSYVKRAADRVYMETFIQTLNDGQGAYLWGVAAPLYDRSGLRTGAVEIIKDITELKKSEKTNIQLQEQLLQAQKVESIGRLAGGVAHDFNNMLGVILGHVELAQQQLDAAHPLFYNLEEIRKAARRSADITGQLLVFARKQTIAPKLIDLNETVDGMLTMLRRLIGEDIHLAWIPGKNLGVVNMDPTQLDQILANLFVNARDAIADTGKVTIETDAVAFEEAYCGIHPGFIPGEYVMLAVSDDGCGMDAETMAHLFEPFYTTKELGKGTGLGLAMIYGIVKQNSGFINVYSEPGQGTTFKVYLPRQGGMAAPTPKGDGAGSVAHGNEVILLVEDEPMILDMTKAMLELQGYKVLPAATPGDAIRLAREHAGNLHLLMTDVVMPEMNGRNLANSLLSLYPKLKCLFMSGYTANVIAHQGVLDEGVHFIQKPFAINDLAAKIREVLDKDPL
jgi:two-component system, cell cycle sensor histidine kinase and response regulator CckA